MNNLFFIKSNYTGGHFALKTDRGKKPFENPMYLYDTFPLRSSDIVIDIGAYIGEYSLLALKRGVKEVHSFEPTPQSFEILNKNKKDRMFLYNKAVVGNNDKFVNLYLSKGIGVTNSTAKNLRKRSMIKVPAINYSKVCKLGNIVKIDVEGAEYSYNIIQPGLRGIILEFHPLTNSNWREKADNIMNKIESSGFINIRRPTFKCGWDLTGTWVRNE